MQPNLILIRHGQSEWNLKNLFTGWADPDLTQKGVEEAISAGKLLKSKKLKFDVAYTSLLIRAQKTLTLVLEQMGQEGLQTHMDVALNERDYGDLKGLNKDDARKKWGDEQVHIWRRSYDVPPPGGESLKDTAERVLPYYESVIEKDVISGKSVIVAAHGNSLRALVMKLEELSPEEILKKEIHTGVPLAYEIDTSGKVTGKDVYQI